MSSSIFPNLERKSDSAPQEKNILQDWTPRRIALATLIALGVGLLFFILYRFYMVVFIFFVALTLQLAMKPIVTWMRKRGLPPTVAVALVYILFLVLCVFFIWIAVPLLVEQVRSVTQQLPDYYTNFRRWLLDSDTRFVRAFSIALPPDPSFLSSTMSAAGTEVSEDEAILNAMVSTWEAVKTTSHAIFIFISVLMLSYYWMLEGDTITRRGLMLVSPQRREEIRTILAEIEAKIGSYFRGQAILCLVVGGLSTIAYFVIGLPYALGLGIFMGVMEAIPMLGPILGAIPALLIALTMTPEKIYWVVGVIYLIQFLENNLLVPKIMDQSVGVHAIVTILAIAAFGILFGLGGAILAIPLAAILQILFNRFVLEVPTGDENSNRLATTVVDRGEIGALRVEAQDLSNDLRKSVRKAPETRNLNEEFADVEDMLEAIVDDLDGLLSQVERVS